MVVEGELDVGVASAWGVVLLWGIVVLSACPVLGWVDGMLISFFTVEPLRLLPMVVAGFLEGLCCVFFGGGLVASA